MMFLVKSCSDPPPLDVQGALASGQALGAIHSYPVGATDPGATCTACKLQAGGIQLRVSGLEPQRLYDHTPTLDVTEPSLRDDLLRSQVRPERIAFWLPLAPVLS
jgi:hypothetical protein